MKTFADIERHISSCDSPKWRDRLLSSVKKSIRLIPGSETSEFEITASRFGGLPYVKKGFRWPISTEDNSSSSQIRYERGQYIVAPLNFIGQINLDAIPFVPDGLSLGEGGVIAFFAATHKFNFPSTGCKGPDWAIVHTRPSEAGELISPPSLSSEYIQWSGEESILYPSFSMKMEDYFQFDPAICYGNRELIDLGFRYPRGDEEASHLFGGYSEFVQAPVEESARQILKIRKDEVRQIAQFESDDLLELEWAGFGLGFFMSDDKDGYDRNLLISEYA